MAHYGTTPALAVFFAASLALAVTPGPGVLYLIARTLGEGRRSAIASIGGVALGNLGNALIACVGLEVLLLASSAAFGILKLAGAAYLAWLGIRELRRKSSRPGCEQLELSHRRAFRDGFLVALLNPKTALFFAAFLPQFIEPHAPAPFARSLLLAGTFVAIAVCTDTLYVLAAGALRSRLERGFTGVWGRRASGVVYLTLGAFLALSDARPAH
ncbi:MAG TPA: LysE family translocator [Steroidobacteraceae bacterium]|nr:LysE family translocator [Steroidobacteraceae bacterium]